jgi:feruloyl esterase
MSNLSLLSFLAALIQAPWSLGPTTTTTIEACARLTSLTLENTTILSASYVPVGTNITLPGACGPDTTMNTAADVCRVYGMVNTTADSAVEFEIWLPDTWYGRFLAVGNGGLGGCKRFHVLIVCLGSDLFVEV